MDHYSILGVTPDASEQELKDAYRNMTLAFHPAFYQGDPSFAKKQTLAVETAYAVLSDPDKRREYDRQRAGAVPAAVQTALAAQSVPVQAAPSTFRAPEAPYTQQAAGGDPAAPIPHAAQGTADTGAQAIPAAAPVEPTPPAQAQAVSAATSVSEPAAAGAQAAAEKMPPMRWYKFVTTVYPILLLLIDVAYIGNGILLFLTQNDYQVYLSGIPSLVKVFLAPALLIIRPVLCLTVLGNARYRERIVYYALPSLMLLDVTYLAANVFMMEDRAVTLSFFLAWLFGVAAVVFGVWMLPNLLYLYKRRRLFFPEEALPQTPPPDFSTVCLKWCGAALAVLVAFSYTAYFVQGIGSARYLHSDQQLEQAEAEAALTEEAKNRFYVTEGGYYYHSWYCPAVSETAIEDLKYIETGEEAESYGYYPCPECVPVYCQSKSYHYPSCKRVKTRLEESISYPSARDAQQDGYSSCLYCAK